ncbi:hypothetical protein P3F83_07775 [Mycobacteroides immunogenum]|uniref:hypothetical protein n=1 Tax=Mycobacteroides immunogenum TaxID=83262 RepID=UPI0025B7994B|nr:hypothetical protein [Mycobacteroides immunogenum]WJR35259.1 hypothetical protein P3F83_07775 [Mycobacteroides immunogenum]
MTANVEVNRDTAVDDALAAMRELKAVLIELREAQIAVERAAANRRALMLTLNRAGVSYTKLAEITGVSKTAVALVIRRAAEEQDSIDHNEERKTA